MNGGMSKIAATDKRGYFQFPLCLLAFGEDYKQRLQHLMSYCVYEQAKRSNPKFPRSARNRLLDEAATFLRVPIGSHENRMRQWKEADSFVREWEQRYGKDANVRIGTSLLWEAKDDSGVSYREFSILCAINSIIGKRRSIPKLITVPSVQARAAGFKSWDLLKSACSDESGKARLLTIDQVR